MFGLGNAIPASMEMTPARVSPTPAFVALSPVPRLPSVQTMRPMTAHMPLPPAYGLHRVSLRLGRVNKHTSVTMQVPPGIQVALANVMRAVAPIAAAKQKNPGMPKIEFLQHEGLWIVDAPTGSNAVAGFGAGDMTRLAKVELPSALLAVMKAMTYKADPGATDTEERGQANFVLGQLTGNAADVVQQKIAGGFAALVDKASVATGVLKLVFTKNPSTLASLAGGDTATHALISEEPSSVVEGALAELHGGVPSTVVEKPTTTDQKLPPWLLPVAIGAGVLVVGAMVLGGKKKARPNRHRRAA